MHGKAQKTKRKNSKYTHLSQQFIHFIQTTLQRFYISGRGLSLQKLQLREYHIPTYPLGGPRFYECSMSSFFFVFKKKKFARGKGKSNAPLLLPHKYISSCTKCNSSIGYQAFERHHLQMLECPIKSLELVKYYPHIGL